MCMVTRYVSNKVCMCGGYGRHLESVSIVYSQGGQKCVLTLLAVLHQPVCKIVCVQLHVSGGAH